MQGYNNLSGGYQPRRVGMNNPNPGNGYPNNPAYVDYGMGQDNSYPQGMSNDERIFVSGRAGADAFPLPRGVTRVILWDNDEDRFYIKGYDNNGRPRVLEDNDFQPHVEPEPAMPQIDLSNYPTKDDMARMISDAFNNISFPNMTGYVTQKELNQALSGLSVGNGGRIVRSNEPDA